MNTIKYLLIYNFLIINLIFNFSNAQTFEFNNLVIFGDSLSDIGNENTILDNNQIITSKVIAGDGLIYNEYLSKIFTGKKIYPANQGGTNYAYSNATVTEIDENSISKTFNQYLLEHKIQNDNLYLIWGAGNDINQVAFLGFLLQSTFNLLNINDYTESNQLEANEYIANMASKLINQGAKYVIVPNLFDIGLIPIQFFIIPYILNLNLSNLLIEKNIISTYLLPLNINEKIYQKIYSVLNHIVVNNYNNLNSNNNIPNTNDNGRDFILTSLDNFHKRYGILGRFISNLFKFTSYLTQNSNYFLEQELQQLDDKIVYVDIYHLFNEIIDNPRFYGFDDILLPTCIGLNNSNDISCQNEEEGVYHSEKTYLWSDHVHPSPFMHMVIAQYIQSIFNAPVLVSSITRQLDSFNQNNNEYIFNQLINFNSNNNIKQLIPFVSINGNVSKIGAPYDYDSKTTYTNSLNIGFNYALNPKLLLGTMLNASYGTFKPYANFKYRYNSQIFNLFSKYQYNNKLFFGVNFNLGRISANNIKRTIILGKGKHLEEGNTKGKSIGFNLIGAYNFQYSNNITLTPYISLNLNNYKVNGFNEKNHNSTAMRYANSSTTNKDIKLSLRATNHNLLNSFIELGLTQPINNNPIKIKSGLKSTKISFVREIYNDKKPSFNLAFGLNKQLKHNLSFNTSLNYKINTNKEQQLNYSLGINMKF